MEPQPRFGLRNHPPVEMDFPNSRGKERAVRILSSEPIGRGAVGEIYRAKVEIEGPEGRTRTGVYVLKDVYTRQLKEGFLEEEARKRAKQVVATSIAMYEELKKDEKIPTWSTYRSNDEGTIILMTDGEMVDDDYLIGFANHSESATKMVRSVEALANIESAINTGIQAVLEASRRKLVVPSDAWFGRFHKGERDTTATFFIGDLDGVTKVLLTSETNPQRSLVTSNLFSFWRAMDWMLQFVLKDIYEAKRLGDMVTQRIGEVTASL